MAVITFKDKNVTVKRTRTVVEEVPSVKLTVNEFELKVIRAVLEDVQLGSDRAEEAVCGILGAIESEGIGPLTGYTKDTVASYGKFSVR